MLIDALHAALEDRIVALDRVRVDLRAVAAIGVAIFAAAMVDGVVLGKVVAEAACSGSLRRS